jgi:phage-related protein
MILSRLKSGRAGRCRYSRIPDAYRVVYAVQIGEAVWVVHAFQKKSTTGIKTPRQDIDLIRERIKRLKEALR